MAANGRARINTQLDIGNYVTMSYALDPVLRNVFFTLSAVAYPAAVLAENISDFSMNNSVTVLPSVTVGAERIERLLEEMPASISTWIALLRGPQSTLYGRNAESATGHPVPPFH